MPQHSMAYTDIAAQIGMNAALLYIIVIWETAWTGIAMWKSARKGHVFWFVVFLLLSLFGIPEIIYLIVTRKQKIKTKIKRKR